MGYSFANACSFVEVAVNLALVSMTWVELFTVRDQCCGLVGVI